MKCHQDFLGSKPILNTNFTNIFAQITQTPATATMSFVKTFVLFMVKHKVLYYKPYYFKQAKHGINFIDSF